MDDFNDLADQIGDEIGETVKAACATIEEKFGKGAAMLAFDALRIQRTVNALLMSVQSVMVTRSDSPQKAMIAMMALTHMANDFGDSYARLIGSATHTVEALREPDAFQAWKALLVEAGDKTAAQLMRAQAMVAEGASATLN